MKTILVPGGAGFIGSHTVKALHQHGYKSIILDNFSNGYKESVLNGEVIEGDIRDSALLDKIFTEHNIDAVIHFAAFIEAGESVVNPLSFYDNNTAGTLNLLQSMQKHKVEHIVFSSTAAVYGQPEEDDALVETLPKLPINPYGQTKWAVECMLRDLAVSCTFKSIALRYFNAAGSDPSGQIGELHEPETHLIPLVLQAASGKRKNIKMFGTDYPTPDGTCIRDYIHVCDLASAHVKALEYLFDRVEKTEGFYDAFNLGTGTGFSVREVIETAKKVTGIDFDAIEEDRRPGDPAFLIANASKANEILGWQPEYPKLEDMIKHAWAFLKNR
ncbi:UDP-glucose 4-epimerase GalE [Kordiimonas sp. SCSIO 12603]|uniref:UDP-glucose 4-epimerase GalE n=1 Tax=Kordiimonas sp. SCSIO 12603 TaxID=2829596 RepID=UPI002102D3ED|nr:UDP-glucose 4-epimerase GalE [Kordiimonas sp. SCSIO 12603]UTW60044.1 UDP-glucose 4-epimerase GalE [Kordiimonas sp. SCSIO 12603]